jgi:hypothetical protein
VIEMPNWVECDLRITLIDNKEDKLMAEFKKFKAFAKTVMMKGGKKETNHLDTNKFIPYPEKFKLMDEAAKDNPVSKRGEYIKDGFNSGGYEWCAENWGTKWGICHAEFDNMDSYEMTYNFDCAWSPCLPVIKKMSEMFPKLCFELRYFECGSEFNGIYVCKNGEIIREQQGEYFGDRGG